MEVDYGQPTAQVGGATTYPDFTFADQPVIVGPVGVFVQGTPPGSIALTGSALPSPEIIDANYWIPNDGYWAGPPNTY